MDNWLAQQQRLAAQKPSSRKCWRPLRRFRAGSEPTRREAQRAAHQQHVAQTDSSHEDADMLHGPQEQRQDVQNGFKETSVLDLDSNVPREVGSLSGHHPEHEAVNSWRRSWRKLRPVQLDIDLG